MSEIPPAKAEPSAASSAEPKSETSAETSSEPKSETSAESGASAVATDAPAESSPTLSDSSTPEAKPDPAKPGQKGSKPWPLQYWVLGIVLALSVELYFYGRNGVVEVCVGKEGVTDFAIKRDVRTAENFRQMPQCSQRLNLGMYNHSEELAQQALNEACLRATVKNREEVTNCLRRDNKWTRQVTKEHVPPWDRRLYRRLLWLD